ncbi:unnamed protein product [Ranitomeya imitator]|uniref:Ig-like domain-containing protein n=1 Tax=Ranitomeya imitator TaxID=111125 RepID=A0ABN9KXP3_9NEOB|nr:unnamed protein product [Ranitomeya imitator]
MWRLMGLGTGRSWPAAARTTAGRGMSGPRCAHAAFVTVLRKKYTNESLWKREKYGLHTDKQCDLREIRSAIREKSRQFSAVYSKITLTASSPIGNIGGLSAALQNAVDKPLMLHGFMRNRSCQTNLISFYEEVSYRLDHGLAVAREVKLPSGPLYRVEGTSVSILCNVSGYEGPTVQNFEWFVYRPGAPGNSIAIASTKDPDFSYAVFSPRVSSGDISIHRVSGDSVELRIQSLRSEDAGVYECYTPTTDARYLGSYSDKITMKVIPDTLHVSSVGSSRGRLSSPPPLQLNLVEGRELHLSCSALSASPLHTHLSVTFGVSASGTPVGRETLQDIISVRWDFSVEPALYMERYLNEEIRVEKFDNSTFKMVIARLRPQDATTYHCIAAQWIQDPDGRWQKITEKRAVLAQVSVQTIDSLLTVSSSPLELRLQSGDMAEMFCSVSMLLPPTPDVLFSVEWWLMTVPGSPGQRVSSMTSDGEVQLGEQYTGEAVGVRHISLEKISPFPGSYRLRIYSAQPSDIGSYSCRVTAIVSYPGARQEEVSKKTSPSLRVLMKPQARDLLLIPMIGGFASALVVGVTILSTVTCCYIRHLRSRKR